MKKLSKIMFRGFSLVLLISMILSSIIVAFPLTANAATVTKTEKSYDIAMVFDNSGSMYLGGSMAWCRAKYAMEIFASMLNYDKDKLHIFPMWEVTTDLSKPAPGEGGSFDPIEIKNEADIDKISNIFTVNPDQTPFAPITEAYDYLKKSNADEKWLIVLTDGSFTQDQRNEPATIDLQDRLSKLASADIKIQYLGIGEALALEGNAANNFFAIKSTDTSLKDDLVGICNSIFQRSVLPANRLNSTSLNIDLSMKNVIVFVQGPNAKITSLKNSNGDEIEITLNSGQRKYSEITANDKKGNRYSAGRPDTSLAGQVVTFGACPKGEYTLSYSDADAIQIFYEPDVSIDVALINSDGQRIENSDELIAGTYTLTSKIVDASTGEDVTSHELMGNNVTLKSYVKTSEESEYTEYENGSKVTFEPDTEIDIYIEGEYLGKYKITSKDDPNLLWLSGFKIITESVALSLKAEGAQSWYTTGEHDTWQPVKVALTLDGQPLTDDQMSQTKLTVTPSGELKYRCEPIKGESAYYVYISQDETGAYVDPITGKHVLSFSATYTDEYGKEAASNTDKVSFEIQNYSQLVPTLIAIGVSLIVLVILAFITLILHKIKVLPNNVDADNSSYKEGGKVSGAATAGLTLSHKSLFKKTGTIAVRSTRGNLSIALNVEAIHPLFKFPFKYQKPSKRRYKVVGISANGMNSVNINGTTYTKDNFGEAKENCANQTTVEFERMVNGQRRSVKADLTNK